MTVDDRKPGPLLLLYRVVAYIVGCGLVILVFVGVPLNWARIRSSRNWPKSWACCTVFCSSATC